jgi:NAD(P)-dependent dehydrogenase (short-subunit alcohol dehydrogenase family)
LFGASSLLARDPSRLKETAASISSDTVWQAADVVDAEQVLDAVSQLASDLDGFDAVVTASGFGTHFDTRAPYEDAVAAWDDEVGVNLRDAFCTIQARRLPHEPRQQPSPHQPPSQSNGSLRRRPLGPHVSPLRHQVKTSCRQTPSR